MIDISSGWERGVGCSWKGTTQSFQGQLAFVIAGLSQYCDLERQLFFILERKRCYMCILRCHIYFCHSWDNFIPNYPSLHAAVQQLHQDRTLYRRQQLLKCNQGLPENTTTNAPKHRKEPASCRKPAWGSKEQHPRYKQGEILSSPGRQPPTACPSGFRNPILYGSSYMLELTVPQTE